MVLPRRHAIPGLAGIAIAMAPRLAASASFGVTPDGSILTVSGRIARTHDNGTVCFDRAMLETLGISGFTTTTPWYEGPVTFEGVRMDALMRAVGADGDAVIATALNGYETRIPVSDFARFDVLLALKRDGEYIPLHDKGPLFIVYPYDLAPELRSQKYYSRSAWRLSRLVVV